MQYQFVDWRNIGKSVTAAASVLGDAQFTSTVDSRLGSVAMLLIRTFAVVFLGPLAGRRPAFLSGALQIFRHQK